MLDDRKSAILRAVVQQYIETAQPVGSTHIVDSTGIGVSSATVRNEMTVLEREGYLAQPHTSAGRVPTEKGYRFFVDELGDPGDLGPAQIRQVSQFFSHATGELEETLRSASGLLARMTATTAVVVGEPTEVHDIRSVQMVELSRTSVLVVAVTSTGTIFKRSIEPVAPLDAEQLTRAQASVAEALIGSRTVSLAQPTPTGDALIDQFVEAAVGAVVGAAGDNGHSVYVEGASHIAAAFEASATLREVLHILEQQLTVVSILHDVVDRGLTVAIGSETGVALLAECSVVVAPLNISGQHAGTIGVLGPTRMNYRDALAAVSAVSSRLSKMLTEG